MGTESESKSISVNKEKDLSREAIQAAERAGLLLLRDKDGLYLTDETLRIQGDFAHMQARLKSGNLYRELIVKAARTKKTAKGKTIAGGSDGVKMETLPLAIDATAGLGEDALLLAATGFRVILYESDPVIAALLRDALQRASEIPALVALVNRMELREEDSIAALRRDYRNWEMEKPEQALRSVPGVGTSVTPTVIYLDPMFPERQKSALVKKKFQLLQRLESPCANEEELLAAALAASPHKILIKRPLKGPWLAGVKPAYSLSGKAVRIDVLLPAGLSPETQFE